MDRFEPPTSKEPTPPTTTPLSTEKPLPAAQCGDARKSKDEESVRKRREKKARRKAKARSKEKRRLRVLAGLSRPLGLRGKKEKGKGKEKETEKGETEMSKARDLGDIGAGEVGLLHDASATARDQDRLDESFKNTTQQKPAAKFGDREPGDGVGSQALGPDRSDVTKEKTEQLLSTSSAEGGADSTAGSGRKAESVSTPLPPGVQFEIRPSSLGKGLGVFALSNIARASEILVEDAAINDNFEHAWIVNEAYFALLSDEKKQRLMTLHSECYCNREMCVETPVTRIIHPNSFECLDNKYAVFQIASRFNHDCSPNVSRGFTKEGFMVLVARRDIVQGEELTINYSHDSGTTEERRRILMEGWRFKCLCGACASNVTLTKREVKNMYLGDECQIQGSVVGKRTEYELLVVASVDSWWEKVQEAINDAYTPYWHALEINKDNSLYGTKAHRAALVTQLAERILQIIHMDNEPGIEETIIDALLPEAEHIVEHNFRHHLEELDLPEARRNRQTYLE